MQFKPKLVAGLAAALLVAACDSSDSDNDTTGIDSFGSAFRAMFAAESNAEPVDAQSIAILVGPTGDPFNP